MNSIYEKLAHIQSKLKVEKSKHNNFGDFDYRSCEDILQAVKPLLAEHGLIILLEDDIKQVGERFYVQSTVMLSDGEEVIQTKAFAREPEKPKAKMDESQTTGSTSSYARKYALNGLFALDDGNDSDKTNNGKNKDGEYKFITKTQIAELKKLGMTDEKISGMVKYYKHEKLEELTSKEAEEVISKKKRLIAKAGGENG